MQLHERIRVAIDSAELSAASVARQLKISRTAVSLWLKGEIKDLRNEHLFKLARLTGFNAEWIALGQGPMRPKAPIDKLSAAEEKLLNIWRAMSPETKRHSMGIMIYNRTIQRNGELPAAADERTKYDSQTYNSDDEIQEAAQRIADQMGKEQ